MGYKSTFKGYLSPFLKFMIYTRVRSRMRELFNLMAFNKDSKDKRM